MARPSKYTEKLAEEICRRIADGESLLLICRDDKIPTRSTVNLWLVDGKHKTFSDNYERAVNIRTDNMFDDLIEIADDGRNDFMERENENGGTWWEFKNEHVQRSRLRVDTRKWYLSKVMPKKYGDKLDVTSDGRSLAADPATQGQIDKAIGT
jgi:hypothetical protein